MKNKITFITLMIAFSANLFGQAAGNYYFNQKGKSASNSSRSNSYDNFDEVNAYQQQAYYAPTITSNDTSFTLQASGLMNAKADEFVIILGTSQMGETIENCHELINKRINDFINAAVALGVNKSDTYVDFISQFPIFEIEVEKKLFSKSYHEIPNGYELKKNIHLKYKDAAIAEKLMIEAAKNEIFDIVKVDYIVNNQQAVYDSLRNACIKLIQTKVSEYGKLGIKTDSQYELVYENISASFPLERYSTYAEFARFTGNQSKMGSRVITRYDVPALYYNRISYNGYDIIINPGVVEPVVQFSCTIKLKYVLKKRL
jgi:uncharacterized protein YggE